LYRFSVTSGPPPYRTEGGIEAEATCGDDVAGDSSDPELDIDVDVASGSISMIVVVFMIYLEQEEK